MLKGNDIRAWVVVDDAEGLGAIVFDRSRDRARSILTGHTYVMEAKYVNLKCSRAREFDRFVTNEPSVLTHGENIEHDTIYRNAGWFEKDKMLICDHCQLYQYEHIPSSKVICFDNRSLCKGCLETVGLGCLDKKKSG